MVQDNSSVSQPFWKSDWTILAILALLKLLLHLFTSTQYGFHRDEFLYIAMGDHLAWGYLEVPPLIAIVAKISAWLFGGSLFGYRFFPALTGAAVVFLTGLMAQKLGGGKFAQILAAVSVFVSPAYLRVNSLFQPVTFDLFFWVLGAYIFIGLLSQDKQQSKLWLALGIVFGLGILTKYTMLLFAFGLLVGLLLTDKRKMLLSKWPWISALIVFVMIAPNLLWQVHQGWPIFEHIKALGKYQFAHVEPMGFILMQLLMNLFTFPIWIIGLYFFGISKKGYNFRPLAWSFMVILAVLLFFSGKAYYLLPAYPMLFAGGSFRIQEFVKSKNWGLLKPAIITWIVIVSIGVVPYGLPILPIEPFKKYAAFMAEHFKLSEPLRWETGELHSIPQDYADMFGWENQVAMVAEVYHSLSSRDQKQCTIFAGNYGQAGAILYYGAKYDLPEPLCVNGSFYLWGPGSSSGEVLIAIDIDANALQQYYQVVQQVAIITHAIARETNVPIFLCRKPNITIQEIWPQLKVNRF